MMMTQAKDYPKKSTILIGYKVKLHSSNHNNGFTPFPKCQVTVVKIKVEIEQILTGEVSEMEFV